MNAINKTNTATMSTMKTYGIYSTVDDHIKSHLASGEHNALVATIIQADADGRTYMRGSDDSIYDLDVCRYKAQVTESEKEESRLVKMLEAIHKDLDQYAPSESEEDNEAGEEDAEYEEDDIPGGKMQQDTMVNGRDKSGKAPKWLQQMSDQKQRAADAKKKKSLLSSLQTYQTALAEVRRNLSEQNTNLTKSEMLRDYQQQLSKAIRGAERVYKSNKDMEYLTKNIHYNMAIWDKKTVNLRPAPKMVERLVSSGAGGYNTVMVPETYRAIVPLSVYLDPNW